MLIFDDTGNPTIIESVFDPVITPIFWTLNLEREDFMFTNIGFLEEHNERGAGLSFGGQYVQLPNSWYILIAEEEDGGLDLIQIKEIRGREFSAFVFEFSRCIPQTVYMETANPRIYTKFCYPIMPKHIMLVHPIDKGSGIIISPNDQYNKWIKGKSMLDFIV